MIKTYNWKTKKLGEVIKLEYGKPLPKISRTKSAKYPVYGANGIKSYSDSFYFDKPSIIVGRKGSAGELKLVVEKFWPLDVTYFVISDEKKYNLKFLYLLLKTLNLPSLARGVKPGINRNDVYSISVVIPNTIQEQERIVIILDEVFEKIEKTKENIEKNLQNCHELLDAYLHGIYLKPKTHWKKINVGQISKIMGGKRVPKGYKLKDEETTHPYIRVTDFNDHGSIDRDKIKYIDDEIFEQIKRYTISSKDLYISIAGTIGKTGIIPKELEGANLTENACKLVFNPGVSNKYVYYFTKSKDFLNQAGLSTRVAAMPKMALSRLANITFFIPESLEEQNDVVKKLDKFSEQNKMLEENYRKKLVNLEELKKSILQQAFDPNSEFNNKMQFSIPEQV